MAAISPAAKAQRAKVSREGKCRACWTPEGLGIPIDPAHVVGRDLGGCDDPACIVPLCRVCHRRQEEGGLDVLPVLTKEEQAHAVRHVGLLSALHLTTGERYEPIRGGR